ncbi:MAG: glycoside hydrolase domain-containing protein [Marmoricola sp.]
MPFLFPSPRARTRFATRVTGLVAVAATALALTPLTTPAYAANPVTPGNFTGLGFDQCEAPSQSAMSTWIKKSPFRAAGIYISGDSRACQRQANLTATWVSNQLAAGWHLMPITLGPQASCTTRDRYLKQVRINPDSSSTYAKARAQGRAEANKAVDVAAGLGIVPSSTLFYDLEAFSITKSSACTWSALWFLHAWTNQLHERGYASGYYSSAASGIRMLDDARVRPENPIALPDQIWIADWNGKANVESSYIRSDGWKPYGRAHQYQGGHNETWGGVTINIDRNYLDLRTPKIDGAPAPSSPPPAPTPTPEPDGPRYTGSSLSDSACTPASISRPAYRRTGASRGGSQVTALQCLLKQQRLYPYEVTGRWNSQTLTGLRGFQRRMGQASHNYTTRTLWTSLLVAGNSGTVVRRGVRDADVVRVQRALNAAQAPRLDVTGAYNRRTRRAIASYQRKVGIRANGMVGRSTWSALVSGRR